MRMKQSIVLAAMICALATLFVLGSCAKDGKKAPKKEKETELASFKVNSMDGIPAQPNVSIDSTISNDSLASLKIEAPSSMNVRLYEITNVKVDNAKLIYRAALRSEKLSGRAYLLMSVHFPDGLESFSRGFEQALIGTVPWVTEEIYFTVEKGKVPDKIKLGLVIEGTGTAWIDDVVLLKAPPPPMLKKRR